MNPSIIDISEINGNNGLIIRGVGDYYSFKSYSTSEAGDINGDGFNDAIIGIDRGYSNAPESGEAYVIFGSQNLQGKAQRSIQQFKGNRGLRLTSQEYGYSGIDIVDGGGDVNGDGFDDVLIGSTRYGQFGDETNYNRGRVYVVLGGADLAQSENTIDLIEPTESVIVIEGENGDRLGSALSYLGDVNGDGFDDIAFTQTGINRSFYAEHDDIGYVLFGSPEFDQEDFASLGELNSQQGFKFDLPNLIDSDTQITQLSDINDDGIDDFAITLADAANNGTTYVMFGSSQIAQNGELLLSNLNGETGFVIKSTGGQEHPFKVNQAGDINHDGIADITLSSYQADENGEGYVLFGNKQIGDTGQFNLEDLNGQNGFVIEKGAALDILGSSGAAGDFNGDGIDDFFVEGITSTDTGQAADISFVVFGQDTIGNTGIVQLDSLNGQNGFGIRGDRKNPTNFRSRLTNLGDINNDSFDDLLLKGLSPEFDDPTGSKHYIIFGSDQYLQNLTIRGTNEDDLLEGEAGNDSLFGLAGNDSLKGGIGDDTLISGTGDDSLIGGKGRDLILGGAGNDVLVGGFDQDILRGGSNNDILLGGTGRDVLSGGLGNDRLRGGGGVDQLRGGAGADQFILENFHNQSDRILDFDVTQDKILLGQSEFNLDLAKGRLANTRFTIGSGASDRGDRFIYNDQTGALIFDADGTGAGAGRTIAFLSNAPELTAANIRII